MPEILVLCTGNVCRSPMGEAFLKHHVQVRGIESAYFIHSAGTGVYGPTIDGVFPGYPASERAEHVMRVRGITLEGHRSKRMVPELLDSADLVIAMAREHLRDALHLHPDVTDRAFLFKEMDELLQKGPLPAEFDLAVAELNARRNSPWDAVALGWDADVDDPIGGDVSLFDTCAAEIEFLSGRLAEALWPISSDLAPEDRVR